MSALPARFWAKTTIHVDGCWEWDASTNPNGYGQFYFEGRLQLAHRVAYEALVGPVPVGLELDHLCRNRACVRPDHLEPVTRSVNLLRGISRNAQKTHCPRGHAYDEANTYRYEGRGGRQCRTCVIARAARRVASLSLVADRLAS